MKDDDEPRVYQWPEFAKHGLDHVADAGFFMASEKEIPIIRDRVVKREGNVLTVDFT